MARREVERGRGVEGEKGIYRCGILLSSLRNTDNIHVTLESASYLLGGDEGASLRSQPNVR